MKTTPQKEKKQVSIQVRMSKLEAGQLRAQAQRTGLSVSAYVRLLIHEKGKFFGT